jgi:hypothetical protein
MNFAVLLAMLVACSPAASFAAEDDGKLEEMLDQFTGFVSGAQWTQLDPGGEGGGFGLSADRKLSYLGKPLAGVLFSTQTRQQFVYVWPPSPGGAYSIACGARGKECSDCFLLRLSTGAGVPLRLCAHPDAVWWAPGGKRALLATFDEGARLFVLDPSSAAPREVPLDLSGGGRELASISSQEPVWTSSDSCRISVDMMCDHYKTDCGGLPALDTPLRQLELDIDIRALKSKQRKQE